MPADDATEFDTATAVRPTDDPTTFAADVDPGWSVGPKPNGGYLLALGARAAGAALGLTGGAHRDPVAASAHYLHAPDPGPIEAATEVLRAGRSASQVRVTLRQGGAACVEATYTLATLPDPPPAPWWSNLEPPALAPIEACTRSVSHREGMPFTVSVMDRADLRLDPAVLGFAAGAPSGSGELRGWVSFADGRPADPLGLLFFLDALPPATFELVFTGWVPTLTLTTYVRARPAPGPLRIRQRAQAVDDGRVDEVCEIWDATGRLVAQASQLAAIRIPEGAEPPAR